MSTFDLPEKCFLAAATLSVASLLGLLLCVLDAGTTMTILIAVPSSVISMAVAHHMIERRRVRRAARGWTLKTGGISREQLSAYRRAERRVNR